MDKHQIAHVLEQIAILLELEGENTFRCLAYRNAARAIEQLEEDLAQVIAEDRLGEIEGIGKTLQEKIQTLVTTGELLFYTELKARIPPGLLEILRIPGMGPKKARMLSEQLGITDLDKLKEACIQGQVAELKGFGAKTQAKILEGIEFLGRSGQRIRIDEAQVVGGRILEALRTVPDVLRLELCGSLRRRKESIQDIDILAVAADPGPLMSKFVKLPGVLQIVGQGETKSSIVVELDSTRAINVDLRVVRQEQFPFALHYFTGSKEHNVAVRSRALTYGFTLNEYRLESAKGPIPCEEETALFRALDLDYIPPELRENTGEIDAARTHALPKLVELGDLKGTFHCHTNWSDGRSTLEEMAQEARRLGLTYLGIADHSQSLVIASGLTPDRVRQQHEAIDELNARFGDSFRLFKGTECDILPDGRLDYDDEVLASFDYVVASVHTNFTMPQEEMTRRIIQALEHPRVTMLGHGTGRLLLRRDGYKVDMEAVLQAAARHGKYIEINAHPNRLDVDWLTCKRAKSLGVGLVINPDAHSIHEISHIAFGIDIARRGWLEAANILNTRSAAEIAEMFARRKKLERPA
jgi:DNA polymerase (family 10)